MSIVCGLNHKQAPQTLMLVFGGCGGAPETHEFQAWGKGEGESWQE